MPTRWRWSAATVAERERRHGAGARLHELLRPSRQGACDGDGMPAAREPRLAASWTRCWPVTIRGRRSLAGTGDKAEARIGDAGHLLLVPHPGAGLGGDWARGGGG